MILSKTWHEFQLPQPGMDNQNPVRPGNLAMATGQVE